MPKDKKGFANTPKTGSKNPKKYDPKTTTSGGGGKKPKVTGMYSPAGSKDEKPSWPS